MNSIINERDAETILGAVVGKNEPITKACELLKSGETLVLDNNRVMNNKHLTFTCDLANELGDGIIRIGHGKTCYSASYIEISKTHIRVFHHYVALAQCAKLEHDLEIKDYVTVNIDTTYDRADITLMSSSGMAKLEKAPWSGRQGDVFIEAEGAELKNIKANWLSDDYRKQIYLFGDSYFNTSDSSRWPSYLNRDGYRNNFMAGFPGMGCVDGLTEFKKSVERGSPKYAVWCLGMNNGDKEGKINPDYLETTSEFLKICKERGIIPILSTIPATPIIENKYKNEWVRKQGLRYIDFARAVGGDRIDESLIGKEYTTPSGKSSNITGNEWYPDMLYVDLVHPAKKGAQALYMQVLVDFPEIIQK